MSSKKKSQVLGMSHGSACNKLRQAVLFDLIVKAGHNQCYQCGTKIENPNDLSIEHKKPWQNSSNPLKDFFDLENIGFSHRRCNYRAAKRTRPTGSDSPFSKIKHEQRETIRNSELKSKILAEQFGVTTRTIRLIRKHRG